MERLVFRDLFREPANGDKAIRILENMEDDVKYHKTLFCIMSHFSAFQKIYHDVEIDDDLKKVLQYVLYHYDPEKFQNMD